MSITRKNSKNSKNSRKSRKSRNSRNSRKNSRKQAGGNHHTVFKATLGNANKSVRNEEAHILTEAMERYVKQLNPISVIWRGDGSGGVVVLKGKHKHMHTIIPKLIVGERTITFNRVPANNKNNGYNANNEKN